MVGRSGDLQKLISHRRERSRSVKREGEDEGNLDHQRWAKAYSPALPPALLALCMADHCGVCDAPFNGPGQGLSHYEGGKHAKKIHFQLTELYRHVPNEEMPKLVSATAKKVEGKSYKTGLKMREEQGPSLPTVEELAEAMAQPLTGMQEEARDQWDPPLTRNVLVLIREDQCAVCNVVHSSEVDAWSHYAGRPHEKLLQKLLVERTPKGGKVPQTRRSKLREAAAGAMAISIV